jgi:hypothetical protein
MSRTVLGLVCAAAALVAAAGCQGKSRSLPRSTIVSGWDVSADGRRVAAFGSFAEGSEGIGVRVWDAASGSPTTAREYHLPGGRRFDAYGGPVALSPDGSTVAAMGTYLESGTLVNPIGGGHVLVFWSVESGEVLNAITPPRDDPHPPSSPTRLTFTADGSAVVYVSSLGPVTVRVADRVTTVPRPEDKPWMLRTVYVPALGRLVEARGTKDHRGTELATWDPVASGPPAVVPLEGLSHNQHQFAISADGRTAVVTHGVTDSENRPLVTFHRLADGREIGQLKALQMAPFGASPEVAISADGALVALAGKHDGATGSVDVYRATDGQRLHRQAWEQSRGGSYASHFIFTQDGKAFFYVRGVGTIVRVNTETGEESTY